MNKSAFSLNTTKAMAEGKGVEPSPRGFRSGLVFETSSRPTQGYLPVEHLVEGVGIEPTRPCLGAYGLASRCITALPTFRRQDDEDDRDRLIGRGWRNNMARSLSQ